MISAQEALDLLREGNHRFVSGTGEHLADTGQEARSELAAGQRPFAIILGCSDSRVPTEIIFNQSLGDLFVIRVAGNIADRSPIGSIEYALEMFGTPLVVVMGHTQCGAVLATLADLEQPAGDHSPNLQFIIDRIKSALAGLPAQNLGQDPESLVRQAVRANILASADQLRRGSKIIRDRIDNHGLWVLSAEYCLETGVVDFFDGLPSSGSTK